MAMPQNTRSGAREVRARSDNEGLVSVEVGSPYQHRSIARPETTVTGTHPSVVRA